MSFSTLRIALPATVLLAAAALTVPAARAQTPPPPVQNVVNLSANGTVQVPQDFLTIILATSAENADPTKVQAELNRVTKATLDALNADAKPGSMDVRTGNIHVYPQYDKYEKSNKKRSFVGDSSVDYGLKKETLAARQKEAQQLAIENFGTQAQTLTKAFGFSSYTLREVNVMDMGGGMPVAYAASARMGGMDKMAMDPAALQAGSADVNVSVQGSVQMTR